MDQKEGELAAKRLRALAEQHNELRETLQDLEKKLQGMVPAQQQLSAQLREIADVQEELNRVGEGGEGEPSGVYKLVGPVLIAQDPDEAKSNVETRLHFVEDQKKRVDALLQEYGGKRDTTMTKIMEIQRVFQQEAQQLQPAAQGAAVAP